MMVDHKFNALPSRNLIFGGTNANGSVNEDYFKSVFIMKPGEVDRVVEDAVDREIRLRAESGDTPPIWKTTSSRPDTLPREASIFTGEEYRPSSDFFKNMRLPQPDKFLVKNQDFMLNLPHHSKKPNSTLKVRPIAASEKTGPRWTSE